MTAILILLACQAQVRHATPMALPISTPRSSLVEVTTPYEQAVYAAVHDIPTYQVGAARQQYVWPIAGTLTSAFGLRGARHHAGIDVAASTGEPVLAAATGVVLRAQLAGAYGNLVELEHSSGWTSRYAHLHRIAVRVGEIVRRGAQLGEVGATGRATGPHLHFELRNTDSAIDPLEVLP